MQISGTTAIISQIRSELWVLICKCFWAAISSVPQQRDLFTEFPNLEHASKHSGTELFSLFNYLLLIKAPKTMFMQLNKWLEFQRCWVPLTRMRYTSAQEFSKSDHLFSCLSRTLWFFTFRDPCLGNLGLSVGPAGNRIPISSQSALCFKYKTTLVFLSRKMYRSSKQHKH